MCSNSSKINYCYQEFVISDLFLCLFVYLKHLLILVTFQFPSVMILR